MNDALSSIVTSFSFKSILLVVSSLRNKRSFLVVQRDVVWIICEATPNETSLSVLSDEFKDIHEHYGIFTIWQIINMIMGMVVVLSFLWAFIFEQYPKLIKLYLFAELFRKDFS